MSQPPFIPKSGQVDYTHIRWAPVINCLVEYQGKFLLVRRSQELRLYPGYWNGISGFLDDQKSFEEKVYEELTAEAGITLGQITAIKRGEIFHQDEPKYHKTWIVHPVLVSVKSNQVKLDWEANEFQWVTSKELGSLQLLPGFHQVLSTLKAFLP